MSEDTGLIERPRIPDKFLKFLKKLTIPFKKVMQQIQKIKNKNIQNGIYGGIFMSLFVLFSSFSIYRSTIAFITAFILVSLISAIVKFIKKTQKYTISQRFGIGLGFTLLFVFCAIVIMLIDTQIGNPVYTILAGLLTMDNSLYVNSAKDSFSSLNDSTQKMFSDFIEFMKLNTEEERNLFVGCLIKYLGVLLVIVMICIAIFKASTDPSALNRNTIPYGLLIVIPLFISFLLFSPIIKANDIPIMLMLGGGFSCFMILIYAYYSMSWTPNTVYYGSYFINILLFIIIAIGLAIVFKVFSGQLKKLSGWPGFYANLLFFVPCLISDGFQYLFQQFRITPNIVILLLFIEIALILLYAYMPTIVNKMMQQKNTSLILNHPVFIDKEIPIGNSSLLLLNEIDDNSVYKQEQAYRTNYAFSMWIYLNSQPPSNTVRDTGTKIFDFGNGKPSIYYKNQSDNTRIAKKDVYVISFTNTGSSNATYEINLPNQKWNNFVFNYFDSKVDLYINGSLERTFIFSDNIPEYLPTDVITVGSNTGLLGAICNVNYYETPIEAEKISTLYNLLFMQNPPINI